MIRPIAILCFALVLFSCGGKTETASDTAKKDSVPRQPEKVDSTRKGTELPRLMFTTQRTAYNDFYLRMGDSMYYCSYKGKFEVADTLGKHRRLLFDLQIEYIVDAIYVYRINKTQYFVAWQETDHRGVQSYFATFEDGAADESWKMRVDAPAPGQPVVDSPFVYISTLGMIGKIDMNTGTPAWKHDSLFDQYTLVYKKFDTPRVYRKSVCFFDFPVKGKKNKRDTIWVDDRSGEMR